MNQAAVQRTKQLLTENKRIAIAVGKNPNIDEMGAALALYLALSNEKKTVAVACPTAPIVEISSLVGIDKVKTSLESEEGDLIVSFPYREGEIEKVSYTLEEGHLNIIVKSGPSGLSFSDKEVRYRRGGSNSLDLLFIVGTAHLSDLGNIFNPQMLKNTTVVNIDNKSQNQGFGDVILVSSRASSVSEQMGELLLELGLPLDVDISQNLLSGIAFATDNFQNSNTTPEAFEMAAVFLKKGARRKQVAEEESPNADYPFSPTFSQEETQKTQTQPFPKKNTLSLQRQNQTEEKQKSEKDDTRRSSGQDMDASQGEEETPPDWLTPKVYKGSTLV